MKWLGLVFALMVCLVSCGDAEQDVVCSLGSCSVGERICEGDGVALVCVDGGDGCGVYDVEPCSSTQVCQVGICIEKLCDPEACSVGSVECDEAGREVVSCVDGGDGCGVEVRTLCSDGAMCRGGQCIGECVDPDQDGYGPGCDEGLDCNNEDASAYPGAGEFCDGVDNDCDGVIDNGYDDLGSSCVVGEGACAVEGRVVCSSGGVDTVCEAVEGAALPVDLCGNGEDDDCDGEIDEGYSDVGSSCTVGQGVCAVGGTFECAPNGLQVVCRGEDLGAEGDEICDGLDNDCDGQVDEGFPNLGGTCSSGSGLCQGTGVFVCDEDGVGVVCDTDARDPLDIDLCGNGVDDDCDGEIDEGFADFGQLCEAGVGACRAVGVRVCASDGLSTTCSQQPSDPLPNELCGNNSDDDCDGEVDEGFEAISSACTSEGGACGGAGVLVCTEDRLDLVCSGPSSEPSDELCDGLDNDCDGDIDEIFGDRGEPCTVGQGICAQQGFVVCAPDAQGTSCSVEPGVPRENELCGNGLDDDCDGEIDEGFEARGDVCTSGLGICSVTGELACARSGLSLECDAEPGIEEPLERCDGLDNTCNGEVDEGDVCGPPCRSDLNEPNDTLEDATILRPSETLEGTVCYYDLDAFDLGFIPRGEVLVVNVLFTHAEGNINLELSRDGEFVASSTSSTDNERLFIPIDRAGNYTVSLGVFANDSAVDYRISTQLADAVCEDDVFESNNNQEEALILPQGASRSLTMCPNDSQGDWFDLGFAEAGALLQVDATFAHVQGNIDLLIWPEGGAAPIAFGDSSTDNETLSFFVVESGRYFLQALSLSGSAQGNPYTLSFEKIDNACQDDDFEPNNARDTATLVNLTQTPFGARTREIQACENDADWFNIGAYAEGDVFQVGASAVSEQGSLRMRLWRDDVLIAIASNNANRPFLRHIVDTPGTYYAEITAVGGNPNYILTLPVYAPGETGCIADEFELDNLIDWASIHPENTWVSYTACPARMVNGEMTPDMDLVHVSLESGQTLIADVEFMDEEGDIAVVLFQEVGPDSFSVVEVINTFTDNERLEFTADDGGTFVIATFLDVPVSPLGVPYRIRYTKQ